MNRNRRVLDTIPPPVRLSSLDDEETAFFVRVRVLRYGEGFMVLNVR